MTGELSRNQEAWLAVSGDLFTALKEAFGVGDFWTFDLRSSDVQPDDYPVQDCDQHLASLQGVTAFTLRKIQAIRYELRRSEPTPSTGFRVQGYAAELLHYLDNVILDDLIRDPRLGKTIEQGKSLTEYLLSELLP